MSNRCVVCGGTFQVKRGLQLTCSVECRRERHRELNRVHYAANREHIREQQRKYREARRKKAPKCSIEGCDAQAAVKGICWRHYRRICAAKRRATSDTPELLTGR